MAWQLCGVMQFALALFPWAPRRSHNPPMLGPSGERCGQQPTALSRCPPFGPLNPRPRCIIYFFIPTFCPTTRLELAPRLTGFRLASTSGGACSCSTATSLAGSPAWGGRRGMER